MLKKFGTLCLLLVSFVFLIAYSSKTNSPKINSSISNAKSCYYKEEASNNIAKIDKEYNKTVQSGLTKDNPLVNNNSKNTRYTDKDIAINNTSSIKTNGSIPVLMYHSINFEKDNPLMVSPKKFDEQMKYLKNNGYSTLSLDELYDYFVRGNAIPKKSIVLTFDDGYVDNYNNLYPILKKHGFKGTIFVITGTVDREKNFLTSAQLKKLDKDCLDIQSHTVAHENLSQLSYKDQVKTLKDSKDFLEKKLNKKVHYLAYPYGKFNRNTMKAAEEAGYLMAVTTTGKWSNESDGILRLNRVYINGFSDMNTFIERITDSDYHDRNNLFKIFWGQVTNFII